MPTYRTFLAASIVSALTLSAAAQQPASANGTGTVTGHVTCGDTQRPARFATVVLFEVPAKVTQTPKPDPSAGADEQMAQALAALGSIGSTNMVNIQTTTDGSYTATDVAPGDYYVFAAQAGYIAPLNQVEALVAGGADLKKPLPGIPVVHVAADHAVNADVTMTRGAAVSGTITWDDGSPAPGAIVTVEPATGGKVTPPAQFGMLAMVSMLSGLMNISDDTGHFRIASLAPGDYVISAKIQTGTQTGIGKGMNLAKAMAVSPLVVYAPAAFHKADAKPLTLHDGEDARDQTIVLKLGGLHSVSGRIASLEDHHGINQATVRITDAQDKEFTRAASVDAQGNYTITFVPAGTYDLIVNDAEDTEPAPVDPKKKKTSIFGPDTKTLRSYQKGKATVIVTDSDVTGQNVDLPIDKNPRSGPDFEKMLKTMTGSDDSSDTPALTAPPPPAPPK